MLFITILIPLPQKSGCIVILLYLSSRHMISLICSESAELSTASQIREMPGVLISEVVEVICGHLLLR